MKSFRRLLLPTAFLLTAVCATPAFASHKNSFFAFLDGFQEVPSVLTDGAGFFHAKVNKDGSIDFRLRLANLSAPPLAAHIHFGQKSVNGSVMITLCGGPPPAIVAACSEDVSGTISADFVRDTSSQGVAAGNFEGALRALRSGNTYVNVHTSNFTGGEVRGQVK